MILNAIRSVHATEIRSSWWKTPQNASKVAYLWNTKTHEVLFPYFSFHSTTTFFAPNKCCVNIDQEFIRHGGMYYSHFIFRVCNFFFKQILFKVWKIITMIYICRHTDWSDEVRNPKKSSNRDVTSFTKTGNLFRALEC